MRLVQGWGVNDVDYVIAKDVIVNGDKKQVMCPYYRKWKNILVRVFNKKEHERYPSYKDSTICKEWKYLSNFIKWVDSQPNRDWISCDLDKDLIISGNKHYSPDTCVFVPKRVNYFVLARGKDRGTYLIGVSKSGNKYRACVKNPYTNCSENLGAYLSEIAAHNAWKSRKHYYALLLADEQLDLRLKTILSTMYLPDTDWTGV